MALTRSSARTWIPVLTLALAAWVEGRNDPSTDLACLTKSDGTKVFIRGLSAFAVHPSPFRVGYQVLTRVRVKGIDYIDVMEPLEQVVTALPGAWARLHVPGGPLGLEGDVSAFVSPQQISVIQPSDFRMDDAAVSMTDIVFVNGTKFRVVEDPAQVSQILKGA
jgi:hypothetical protein